MVKCPSEVSGIRREFVKCNSRVGLSRFQESTLSQARIEEVLLGNLSSFPNIRIDWNVSIENLVVDNNACNSINARPVRATLRRHEIEGRQKTKEHEHSDEVINAKYVVGCDGAHSWTRKSLAIQMLGKSTESTWGVIDLVPITNFRKSPNSKA